MGFDFTIAVAPSGTDIDRELQYVKSALLYADKVTLISPLAYLYTQLVTKGSYLDERTLIRLVKFILPMLEEEEPEIYRKGKAMVENLSTMVFSKQYKGIPLVHKLELKKAVVEFCKKTDTYFLNMIGETQAQELNALLRSQKLVLQKFEHTITDIDSCVAEYFGLLTESVKSSYPLFDETSNNLMGTALKAKIINLSDSDKRKITHAGMSSNMIQRLPSFDLAPVDEIIDIRKELNDPLVRFRGKMLAYSENIQSLPWDVDFENECAALYHKEIVPAVLEIEELTKDNCFLKNLGRKVVSDGEFLKSAGGLVVGIAAAGVIPSFTQAVSADTAIIATGGAWAATKIAATYDEYRERKKEIERKDMYFYYQTGKLLEK